MCWRNELHLPLLGKQRVVTDVNSHACRCLLMHLQLVADLLCQFQNHQPYLLLVFKVSNRGRSVTDALYRRLKILAMDNGVVLSIGKPPQGNAVFSKFLLEPFRVSGGKIANRSDEKFLQRF